MLLFYLSLIDTYDEQVVFEMLYNTYREDMYQSAYYVVHNQYDAEDAVHEAFISIIHKLSVISPLESQKQKAYVCRAARNCAINICSKQERERRYGCNAYYLYSSNDEDDLLEDMCRKESAQNIKSCILSLPEPYRDVLHLHYVEGLKQNKIANLLGLKGATVRQRLLRGKRMLIESLNALEGIDSEKEE